jgi:acyl-CoA thioesterase-1
MQSHPFFQNSRRSLGALLLTLGLILMSSRPGLAEPVRILALGDSLTAGYGLKESEGFVPQLAQALAKMGRDAVLINGGVSGDTSADGLGRVDWMLADRPDVVILELGANDSLRGLDPETARANLDAIITRIKASGAKLLLAGMQAPRNLDSAYVADFDSIYPDLAAKYGVRLYPFFLDGVAARPEFNQADGLHPTPEGVAIIVKRLLPVLLQVIDEP